MPANERAFSWSDLGLWLAEMEKEHRGHVRVIIERASYSPHVLTVTVDFQRVRGRNDWWTVCYEQGRWPSRNASTMPQYLWQLATMLGHAVERYDRLPVVQSAIPEEELPPPPERP